MKKFGYLLLLTYSGYILYLRFISNTLFTFINPKFELFIVITSIIIFVISIFCVIKYNLNVKYIKKYKKLIFIILSLVLGSVVSKIFLLLAIYFVFIKFKDDDSESLFKAPLILLSLFIPLIGFFFPKGIISSVTADLREGNFNSIELKPTKTIFENFRTDTINYSLGDWINLININSDPLFYKGKKAKVSGFVFKSDKTNYNEFFISRFAIRCCAADAVPVGILVKTNELQVEDTWLEIEGTMEFENELFLIPEKITKIEKPNNPYIL